MTVEAARLPEFGNGERTLSLVIDDIGRVRKMRLAGIEIPAVSGSLNWTGDPGKPSTATIEVYVDGVTVEEFS